MKKNKKILLKDKFDYRLRRIFPHWIIFKKNNYGQEISSKTLNYVLNEAKNQCKKTVIGNKIIHMLVDGYLIDNNIYTHIPTNLRCDFFSLDLNFICLPELIIKDLEKILKNIKFL